MNNIRSVAMLLYVVEKKKLFFAIMFHQVWHRMDGGVSLILEKCEGFHGENNVVNTGTKQ
jgi:hypothetical protein